MTLQYILIIFVATCKHKATKKKLVTFCHLSFIVHLIARPFTKYLLSRIYANGAAPDNLLQNSIFQLHRLHFEAGGARQDWPSISIFPPPFYMKHKDFGAHWAQSPTGPGFTKKLDWPNGMYHCMLCGGGHVKLPTIRSDLMMLTGKLYQDAWSCNAAHLGLKTTGRRLV